VIKNPTVSDCRRWIRQIEKALDALRPDRIQHDRVYTLMQEEKHLYIRLRDGLLAKERAQNDPR
jgi:hypothetical protein